MFKYFTLSFAMAVILCCNIAVGQARKIWTETDRNFLVENLERSKRQIVAATQSLSPAQWAFREDSTKWSAGQVLEHLGLYERIFAQEADIMLSIEPDPLLDSLSLPDTAYIHWMNEPGPHTAEWNAVPLGLMQGADNLTFFLFGRNHITSFIKNTTYDLKSHFTYRWGNEKRRSIHALMVVHFAHTDRHLKQIQRIQQSPAYPH